MCYVPYLWSFARAETTPQRFRFAEIAECCIEFAREDVCFLLVERKDASLRELYRHVPTTDRAQGPASMSSWVGGTQMSGAVNAAKAGTPGASELASVIYRCRQGLVNWAGC